MKAILVLVGLGTTCIQAGFAAGITEPAKDTLYLRNREKQAVEIKEVYPDKIRFSKVGDGGGKIQTLAIKDIAHIVYNSGAKDVFNDFDVILKPDIQWLSEVSYVDKPELRVEACVLNAPQSVQIDVNGVVASVTTRSFKTLPAKSENCAGGMPVSHLVKLKEGPNEIKLLAVNAGGTGYSKTMTVFYEKPKKRIALVIGNSKYEAGNMLPNPENDARAMTQKLTGLGFDVIERINTRQGDLRAAVAQFGSSVQSQDYEVALFYYAGHGIQVAGRNYLMPVDISPQSEMELKMLAVSADEVLDQMSTENASERTNVMILDACRDNPLSRSWTRSTGGKGLASMDAPPGSLITFSTKPGSTALDGDGKNSPYTSELLKVLDQPGLGLEEIFKKVRVRVMEVTKRQQVPMENSLLTRELVLNKMRK